jgi:hypothetical protein
MNRYGRSLKKLARLEYSTRMPERMIQNVPIVVPKNRITHERNEQPGPKNVDLFFAVPTPLRLLH